MIKTIFHFNFQEFEKNEQLELAKSGGYYKAGIRYDTGLDINLEIGTGIYISNYILNLSDEEFTKAIVGNVAEVSEQMINDIADLSVENLFYVYNVEYTLEEDGSIYRTIEFDLGGNRDNK